MGTITATVNTDGGGDFSSLSAAEAALRQDLTGVTCDVPDESGNATIALDILCSGSAADTTAVAFSHASWVTDATHRIRARLNGTGAGAKWDSSLYRLVASTGYAVGTLSVGKALHLTFQDLQVEATNTIDNAPTAMLLGNFAHDVTVVRGYYRQSNASGSYDASCAIRQRSTGAFTLKMQNVTMACADGIPFRMDTNGDTGVVLRLYNCTGVNRSGTARNIVNVTLASGADVRLKNLLLQGTGTANYYMGNANPDEALTILTQDTSSPTTGLRSKTLAFVDASGWDYHLASGDTAAIDVGTDLHADSYWAFSTDGDGNSRPNGAWDVGAHEYGAGAPTAGRPAWRNMTRIADRAIAVARW